jgi:5-methylcytosine-specific restriction endonuclease McrA
MNIETDQRTCSACGLSKPLNSIHFEAHTCGFRRVCRACRCAQSKSYPCRRNFSRTPEQQAVRNADSRAYRRENPEKDAERKRIYRKARKPQLAQYARLYRAIRPEVTAVTGARKRAVFNNVPNRITAEELFAQRQAQNSKCFYCGSKFEDSRGRRPTVDHIIPLHRGGANTIQNIVYACESCNLSKGKRTPWEWRSQKSAK